MKPGLIIEISSYFYAYIQAVFIEAFFLDDIKISLESCWLHETLC